MSATCFGSEGAARVMRKATGRARSERRWALGRAAYLACDSRPQWRRSTWWLTFAPHIEWAEIGRDIARIILRGLLGAAP